MSSESKSFYITTPIYYVNDKPHIGHAYTSLACDVMARFKRLDGYEVKFLTGTDEHGQKVEKSAEAAGLTPQEFVDAVSESFRELTVSLNLSNSDFIRTTEERHIRAAQKLWLELEDKGDIYLGKYAGWYSVRDEAFYTEEELVDGRAPTGASVEWVEEESYFFRLSKWQDKLLELYESNPEFVAPESRRNEVISFVKGGLHDLSISRTTFSWGVPVPDNDGRKPENVSKEKHIMYVWLDALVNYLTSAGYAGEDEGSMREYSRFWPADLHIVGKDILRFHAVYWPAFLMSAGIELPRRIFAHGWWTNDGQKISKSLGNTILTDNLISIYGLDQTRYFLMREVPFGNDGNFSRASMINRINADLANNIGNLVQRTISMMYKNCDATIPDISDEYPHFRDGLSDGDAALRIVRGYMERQKFHLALEEILEKAHRANEKIDREAPWVLRKEGTKEALSKMRRVLYELADEIRQIAILLQPFTPDAAGKILDQLKVADDDREFVNIAKPLHMGVSIEKPRAVFPRFQLDVEE